MTVQKIQLNNYNKIAAAAAAKNNHNDVSSTGVGEAEEANRIVNGRWHS